MQPEIISWHVVCALHARTSGLWFFMTQKKVQAKSYMPQKKFVTRCFVMCIGETSYIGIQF